MPTRYCKGSHKAAFPWAAPNLELELHLLARRESLPTKLLKSTFRTLVYIAVFERLLGRVEATRNGRTS